MDGLSSSISAIGTLAATTVSLFLLWQSQVDRRELRRLDVRKQASKVTIWAGWHTLDLATLRNSIWAYPTFHRAIETAL